MNHHASGLFEDATAALEESATRIARAAATQAVQDAMPAVQRTLADPAVVQAFAQGVVREALAPSNRAAVAEVAGAAGRGAAPSVTNTLLVGALGFAVGFAAGRWQRGRDAAR